VSLNAGILGVGKALPDRRVTNDDLVKMGVDTNDAWIVERTGIKARYVADADTATSDLAIQAAKQAMAQAGTSPEDIDMVICATSTPDHPLFPATACIIQAALGIPTSSGAMDLGAACTGFNYALTTAQQYIENGHSKTILVVSADILSKFLDWKDRSVSILFGDGGGAVIVSVVPEGTGLRSADLFSNGNEAKILQVPDGGSRTPLTPQSITDKKQCIFMNGRSVFKVAINAIVPAVQESLEKAGVKLADIDLFVFHQANLRLLENAASKLGIPLEKMMITVDKYGNTSASSIVIALTDAVAHGRLKKGDRVLVVGFGAGFTWGINHIIWSY
jgi:3-oxoacyl-[acyl-carrier-protein] synthase-3